MARRLFRGERQRTFLNMIADCAIDPEVFATWRHFQSLSEDFGVGRGRIISEFPRRWRREVIKKARGFAASDTPNRITTDLQASRIASKLGEERFRRKLKSSGRSFDSSKSNWRHSAACAATPFDLIIISGSGTSGNRIGIDDLLKDEAPFFRKTQDQIERTSQALVDAARLLVSSCDEFILVDPNFRADEPRFYHTLRHLIRILEERGGDGPKRLEIHTSRIRKKGEVFIRRPHESQWKTHIEPHLPSGWKISVCYWENLPTGGKLHPRFLLTEMGGLYYDHGLDEGEGRTLVTLLEDEIWESLFKTFNASALPEGFDTDEHVFLLRGIR